MLLIRPLLPNISSKQLSICSTYRVWQVKTLITIMRQSIIDIVLQIQVVLYQLQRLLWFSSFLSPSHRPSCALFSACPQPPDDNNRPDLPAEDIACLASVSVWFRSKERPRNLILGFGCARNETRAKVTFYHFKSNFLEVLKKKNFKTSPLRFLKDKCSKPALIVRIHWYFNINAVHTFQFSVWQNIS